MLHNGRIEIGETPLEKSASEVKADGSWPVFEGKGFPDEFGSCHEQQEKKKRRRCLAVNELQAVNWTGVFSTTLGSFRFLSVPAAKSSPASAWGLSYRYLPLAYEVEWSGAWTISNLADLMRLGSDDSPSPVH